jgi:hypothetical protein
LCADACGIGPLLSFILFFWGDFGEPADTFVPQFFVKKIKKKKISHAPLVSGLVVILFFLGNGYFSVCSQKQKIRPLILLGCF